MTEVTKDEQLFLGPVRFAGGKKIDIGQFNKLDTTPDVKNGEFWKCINVVGTTVTQFDNGYEGQALSILGEGFTTIANNANIKTNTGANKLLAANKVYRFTRFNKIWYEDA